MMDVHTALSSSEGSRHQLRGHDLLELVRQSTFLDVLFLLWRGTFPAAREVALAQCMLIAVVEHGVESPSTLVSRVVASVGNPFHVALAAGVLAVGERHGGATTDAAILLNSEKSPEAIVDEYTAVGRHIPGFGHPVYKEEDPRATVLFARAKELGFPCTFFSRAYAIADRLRQNKGKMIPLNVDGALAAGLLELGLRPELGVALFLLARTAGMSAHILEEMGREHGYLRLPDVQQKVTSLGR